MTKMDGLICFWGKVYFLCGSSIFRLERFFSLFKGQFSMIGNHGLSKSSIWLLIFLKGRARDIVWLTFWPSFCNNSMTSFSPNKTFWHINLLTEMTSKKKKVGWNCPSNLPCSYYPYNVHMPIFRKFSPLSSYLLFITAPSYFRGWWIPTVTKIIVLQSQRSYQPSGTVVICIKTKIPPGLSYVNKMEDQFGEAWEIIQSSCYIFRE